jgi:hypothetical protein
VNRLKEPSTWAGLAALFQGLKFVLPPQWHPIVDGVVVATGGLAVAMREGAVK